MTRFATSTRFARKISGSVPAPTKGTTATRELAVRSGLRAKTAQPGFSGQALAAYLAQRPSIPAGNILRQSTSTPKT